MAVSGGLGDASEIKPGLLKRRFRQCGRGLASTGQDYGRAGHVELPGVRQLQNTPEQNQKGTTAMKREYGNLESRTISNSGREELRSTVGKMEALRIERRSVSGVRAAQIDKEIDRLNGQCEGIITR